MATNINNKIVCSEPHANLDSYYGPYNSVEEAFEALADTTVNGVTYTKKYIGLTVGVWNTPTNEIIEYWFQGGTSMSNLVPKTAGLPGGVKIITFDKNGGTGAQNSIISDTEGYIVLPNPTIQKTGCTFSEWSYNGMNYQPGEAVEITSSTTVQAVWQSSEVNYIVNWTVSEGVTKINGWENENEISSVPTSIREDTMIRLQCVESENYRFVNWNGLPNGVVNTSNPVEFALTGDINATANTIRQYTVEFSMEGEGVIEVNGMIEDGEKEIGSGDKCDKDSVIILTAVFDDGYEVEWNDIPGSSYTIEVEGNISRLKLEPLNSDVNIKAVGKKVVDPAFYYYGCTAILNNENEIEVINEVDGESGESGNKYFNNVSDLIPSETNETDILDNQYNILYVITKDNIIPKCVYSGGEILFMPLNECGDSEIIEWFNNNSWVINGTNETYGELSTKGNYVFILIDNDKILDKENIRISVNE